MPTPGPGGLPLPMLAVAGAPPAGPGWAVEFKWDGVRALVDVGPDGARLVSRNGRDITGGYPELSVISADRRVLLDGEIVALDGDGRPDFGLLQQRMHVRDPDQRLLAAVPVSLYVFDLLAEDGEDLLGLPYDVRRERLDRLVPGRWPRVAAPAAYTDADPAGVLEVARRHGLEGIVSKRRDARYEPGRRSRAWLKTALVSTQEVVVGGWTPGQGNRTSTLGALLLGAHDAQGRLRYLGHVGTGFSDAALRVLLDRLTPLRRNTSAFDEEVPRDHARRARWVEPLLVGEVEYRTLTRDGRLRHAAWRGLRPDRDPDEVTLAAAGVTEPVPRPAQVTRAVSRAAGPAGASPGEPAGEPTEPTDEPDDGPAGEPGTAGATPDELAALDELGSGGTWRIGGRDLALTNLDKELFPGAREAPVTKRDLLRYHATIAPDLLPYLTGRPVNLHRFPDGAGRPGFWQKEVPTHAPAWIRRWRNPEADPGETQVYFVVDSTAALVWLANYGALELHPWTSALPDVHRPTWALIDIDPGPRTTFAEVLHLARLYRTALEHLGVAAAPKVTGRRGIQAWVPIGPGYGFDDTRRWVEKLSRAVGRIAPELVSWQWHTDRRRGLARLDYTQNAINKTLVAPLSPRPAPDAPVSVPITWDELDDPDLTPDRWTLRTAPERLRRCGDPLRPLIGRHQTLPPL